ncbi:MAG: endonuclease [Lysobacterales bacterium]|nr:MAG: endonuclease [Xanthomonadales bacterium]
MSFAFLRWLCLFIALIAAFPAAAFGPLGHRLIAALAEERLSPEARAAVADLLGEGRDLAAISTWADELRDQDPERGRATARWHFVNIPREAGCRFEEARDCPEGQCIVAALRDQATLLGERSAPIAAREEALKWAVHLVADIHQPLHAGYPDDRGGNLFQVHVRGRGSNLHALWDSGLLESRGLREAEYLARLRERMPAKPGKTDRWSASAPKRWAEESCALIEILGLYPPRPGRLPKGYLEQMRPHLEERMVLAALRLAALIESSLGAKR